VKVKKNHQKSHRTANRVQGRKPSIFGKIFRLRKTWNGQFKKNENLFNFAEIFDDFVNHVMKYIECEDEDKFKSKIISEFFILLGEFVGTVPWQRVIRQMESFDTCCNCCYESDGKSVDENAKHEFATAISFFLRANYDAERKTIFSLCKNCLAKIVGTNKAEPSEMTAKIKNKQDDMSKLVGKNMNVEKTLEAQEEMLCKICMSAIKDCLLLPCFHYCMCFPCATKVKECPYCRAKVTDRRKIFTV